MFVLVQWDDAEQPTSGQWLHRKDVERPALTTFTCGYLVYQDERIVQVAVSVSNIGEGDDSEQYTGVMTVPRGCVVSMQEVAPVPPKPKTRRR